MAYGMPKSGSTLAFELTRGLLLRLGHPQDKRDEVVGGERRVNFLDLVDGADDDLRLLDERVPLHQILVVKTHSAPTQAVRELAGAGRLICQAVFRDPRDNVLSLTDAGARDAIRGKGGFLSMTDMDVAVRACVRSFEVYEQWCEIDGVLTASYDEVAFRSEDFLRRVLAQTGCDGQAVDLAALCDEVKQERFTQFNKGLPRRYRHDLSTDACLRITARFADIIERHMEPELDDLDRALLPLARSFGVPESFAGLYCSTVQKRDPRHKARRP